MGTKMSDKRINYSHKPNKPNNKLVNAYLEHFWCKDKPRLYMNSQDSPWFELGGSHHFPPYRIICAWPQGFH
jgi:hypothetical protein